ncbi:MULTISPECIES: hypothetical protein [Paraburkholderia]|uniref:hypothetical protein n=1 Tax=Paraburkholderia TaxID=1822464 RepID=UPI001CC4AE34|nr:MULTISPECIES: hypothetical protein [Paraburkholderia]
MDLFTGHLQAEKKCALISGGKPRFIKDFGRFFEIAPCKCQLHSRKLAFGSMRVINGVTEKSNSEVGRCDARQRK